VANLALLWKITSDIGVLSGGSFTSSLPLSNLQTQNPKDVARSNDLAPASTNFTIDLASALPLQLFALVNNNLSASGTVRFRASNHSDGSSPLIDSTAIAGNPFSGDTPPGGWTRYYLATASQSARYIVVEMSDAGNAAGYLQAGRFLAGVPFIPGINIDVGVTFENLDESAVSRAVAGDRFVDVRPRRRRLKGALSFLTEAEAFGTGSVYELLARGINGEVLAIVDSDDDATMGPRRTIYGALTEVAPLSYARNGTLPYAYGFTIEEFPAL
jgi:hypothetical protein